MSSPDAQYNKYISIVDCETCKNIPQIFAHYNTSKTHKIPPEINELVTIIEFYDNNTDSYCSSTTRLLKCISCGSYYYWNHYDNEGHWPDDPPSDELSIRRYNPLTTMRFLENILGISNGIVPNAFGQLKKAFAEGTSTVTPDITIKNPPGREVATSELQELQDRYDALIGDLIIVIKTRSLDWQIKMYIMETLCAHFFNTGDFDALLDVLLNHADPVIRAETALYIIGMATGDAPVIDIIHVPGAERDTLERKLKSKVYLKVLAQVLLDVATSAGDIKTMKYDHGLIDGSNYNEWPLAVVALYGLVVAAEHTDLSYMIPSLVSLLPGDKGVRNNACWVLRTIGRRKTTAQLIIDGLNASDECKKLIASKDPDVKQLMDECQARLIPKIRKKKKK